MRRIIGITKEKEDIDFERKRITELLYNNKICFFHIRKPSFSENQMRDYLSFFPMDIRERLSLNSFHLLAKQMNIGGIHLNRSNPKVEEGLQGKRISMSCHSIKEVIENKDKVSYLFLSPIFDSISKQGYQSNFSPQELKELFLQGILNDKVVALSGVTYKNIPQLEKVGFSSFAMLSELWKR